MNICAIAVPYDSGHYRGRMGLGPERLLAGGIRSLIENLGHSLTVEEIILADGYPAEIKTAFALCREVSNRVQEVRRKASFPLVLSGNCNTAVAAVAGCGAGAQLWVLCKRPGGRESYLFIFQRYLSGGAMSVSFGQFWRDISPPTRDKRVFSALWRFETVPGKG